MLPEKYFLNSYIYVSLQFQENQPLHKALEILPEPRTRRGCYTRRMGRMSRTDGKSLKAESCERQTKRVPTFQKLLAGFFKVTEIIYVAQNFVQMHNICVLMMHIK